MENCSSSPSANFRALQDILAYLKSLLSKGLINEGQLDFLNSKLRDIIESLLNNGSLKPSQIRSAVDMYLPTVISRAETGTTVQQSPITKFGDISGNADISKVLGNDFFSPNRGTGNNIAYGNANTGFSPNGNFGDANSNVGIFNPTEIKYPGSNKGGLGQSAEGDGIGGMDGSGSFTGEEWNSGGGGLINTTGSVAVSGIEITSDEIRDYFNGYVRMDDDSFSILLWLGKGKNPLLLLESLSYAKRLHNNIILPTATYYKKIIYGNPNYPIRLGQIIYGIIPETVVSRELQGSVTSRHRVGQAVNFKILGVDNDKIIEDLTSGKIVAEFGAVALTAGVHASLPFFAANGEVVHNLLLWTDNGVPNFVGYKFT